MYPDIEVGLTLDVLDPVDPRFEFSVLEDGKGVTGRVQGHADHIVCTEQVWWRGKCWEFDVSYMK